MAQLGKNLQEMANDAAAKIDIDPLAARTEVYYEYAPKSPEGVIWWVYKTLDENKIEVSDGWTLVRRKMEQKIGEWEDVTEP